MRLHSVTDVITNSSSELFIFMDNQSKEEIERKLNLLKELASELGVECGCEVDEIDKSNVLDELINWDFGYAVESVAKSDKEKYVIIQSDTDNSISGGCMEVIGYDFSRNYSTLRIHQG